MKRLLLFALLAALVLPGWAQDEMRIDFINLLRPRVTGYALNLNQNLRTTDSPAFAGLTLSGPITLPDGSVSSPVLHGTSDIDTGIYWITGATRFTFNGASVAQFNFGGLYLFDGYYISLYDTTITREDTNVIQLSADAAAPADFTLKAADGSGTDKPGGDFILAPGRSTGTGAGGDARIATSTVGSTGTTQNVLYDRIVAVGKVVSLVNNSDTPLFSVACADGNGVGGYIDYAVEVKDGTDVQVESGIVTFSAVNKATETWTTDIDKGTLSSALSGSTLTVTCSLDTATADTLKFIFKSNSGLTPTSTMLRYQIHLNSPQVITIL